jgi:hypothetical protein
VETPASCRTSAPPARNSVTAWEGTTALGRASGWFPWCADSWIWSAGSRGGGERSGLAGVVWSGAQKGEKLLAAAPAVLR